MVSWLSTCERIDTQNRKESKKNLGFILMLKKKIDLNYTSRGGSYRAVNTFRLGNENQSVNPVQRNYLCRFWGPYKTHKYIV